MSKQNIDWSNLGFGYIKTDYRYVCRYKDGQWDEGGLETDANITLNECACVFQYCQACFEGMKAYYTKDGHIVCFRPDMNEPVHPPVHDWHEQRHRREARDGV